MRVGLLGGSFNPAHAGHRHVAETARKRLGLQRVIWLVSPQNPLKSGRETRPLSERMRSAREAAHSPSAIVSDAETRMGVRYTVDALRLLQARHPGVRFVWLMGGDNLGQLHRWKGWTDIVRRVPVAVVARPGGLWRTRFSPAARRLAGRRVAPGRLAGAEPPAWTYLPAPLNPLSSSALRARPVKEN